MDHSDVDDDRRPEAPSAPGLPAGPAGASSGAARDPLALLTARYEELGLSERAAALVEARRAGKKAAGRARDLEELEAAPAVAYCDDLVENALAAGLIEAERSATWRRSCEDGSALRDPRIQAFFFGWHERATEILAELAAAEGDEELRARWFLSSLKP